MTGEQKTDVLIIGAGIAGVALARELSKYQVEVLVIEKAADICQGISKGSHGYIYTGVEMTYSMSGKDRLDLNADDPEMRHIRTAREGYKISHDLLHDLDVEHTHQGDMIVVLKEEHIPLIENLADIAKELHALDPDGVKIIDRDTLLELEPNVTPEAIAALYDEECIICFFPPEFVLALAENSIANGVKIKTDTRAKAFAFADDLWRVDTNQGQIQASFVINAAGHHVVELADIANERDNWELHPIPPLQMTLFGKTTGSLFNNHLRLPFFEAKLVNLSPIHDGKAYMAYASFNPNQPPLNLDGTATSRESFQFGFEEMKKLLPAISEDDVITSWVGTPIGKHGPDMKDNNMQLGKNHPSFITVTPMMPAYGPSPLVAAEIVDQLKELGLSLVEKERFINRREAIPRFKDLSDEEKDALIAKDSRYGHVICRCESITEGEIVEAIKRGATTVQGIKYRTRASMGECQANFCGRKVLDILSRELKQPIHQITEKGRTSAILAGGGRQ